MQPPSPDDPFAQLGDAAEEDADESGTGEEVFGGETGVAPATLSEDAARYYDLQGRPVDGTQKGILIRNGKKVIVK